MARIALDAMGGDFAPRAPIAGALQALEELDASHSVQLVGRTDVVSAELENLIAGELSTFARFRDRIEIIEAPDVIEMSDRPTAAVRKQGSSMFIGLQLQVDGHSDGFVSAGNTGAQMAASKVLLSLHADLTRPAIATLFPTVQQPIAVLDSGANVDCSASELLQFAWLGSVYAECVLGRDRPSIGLLSIGEEPAKGNAVVKEAHPLFAAAGFNFHGNVEGRDIPAGGTDRGPIDVVICDGFTGNIILKLYEAVLPMIVGMLNANADIKPSDVVAALKPLDVSEYGGAPLLGVQGVSVIAHGNASPRAIKNAVKAAVRAVDTGMNEQIGLRLAESAASQKPAGSAA